MYIATGYFGTGNQLIASGGIETLWISGSIRYKSHEFRGGGGIASGTFQVLSGKTSTAEILVVGGGGAGGSFSQNTSVFPAQNFYGGGGGGGGFIYSSSITLQGGSSYGVSAGVQISNITGSTGNPSQISGSNLYISASGGGGGANGNITAAKNGGSGGGGGSVGGTGISGQGSNGGVRASPGYFPSPFDDYFIWGGGGGGAAGNGGNGTNTANGGGAGGRGKISRILNGTTLWYSGGGGGDNAATTNGGSGSIAGSATFDNPQYTLQGQSNRLAAGLGANYDFSFPGTVIIKYPYQAVNVNNCDCYQFSVTGSATTGSLMSYVQGGTGNFVEGQALAANTTTYISVVSGSQSQIYNWNLNSAGGVATYSFAYSGFCTSSI